MQPSYPEPLFKLPNGSPLKFKLKKSYLGNQYEWKNTFVPTAFEYPSKKSELPLLGLWNSQSAQHIICLDIDELPSNFKSWAALLSYCKKQYPNQLVNHSYSGKVKVWFLVEAEIMNQKIAERFLADHLPEEQPIKVDPQGVSRAYFDARIAKEVSEWLASASPIQYQVPSELLPTFKPQGFRKYNKSHSFKVFNGEISCSKLKDFIVNSRAKEGLLRRLLSTSALVSKTGWGLSTIKLAREIGCSDVFVHKCLKELVKLGFLKVLDNAYKIGLKSITYVARKSLRKAIKSCSLLVKKAPQKLIQIPEINDGEWDNELFKLAHKVKTEQQYFEIVEHLPGVENKGRLEKAHRVWARIEAFRNKNG